MTFLDKKLNPIKIFAVTIIFGSLLFGGFVFAQEASEIKIYDDLLEFLETYRSRLGAQLGSASQNVILLEIAPEFPGPNEKVTVLINSFAFDVDRATIVWTRGGKTVLRGLGRKSYTFTTGKVGQLETIKVFAISQEGIDYELTKSFRLGDVDLMWRAETDVPPGYRGKALPSPQSDVTVTAFPHFFVGSSRISPDNLIYEWFYNGRFSQASGTGRRTFSFSTGALNGGFHEVKLKISNLQETIVREKTIRIPIKNPKVILYEERPLEGPNMARAVDGFPMFPGEEKEFRAVPYFFAKDSVENFTYLWRVGGKSIEQDEKPDILQLKIIDDAAPGEVLIEVVISNIEKIFQQARISVKINIL